MNTFTLKELYNIANTYNFTIKDNLNLYNAYYNHPLVEKHAVCNIVQCSNKRYKMNILSNWFKFSPKDIVPYYVHPDTPGAWLDIPNNLSYFSYFNNKIPIIIKEYKEYLNNLNLSNIKEDFK